MATTPNAPQVEKLAFSARETCTALSISRVQLWRIEKARLINRVPGLRSPLYARHEIERFLRGEHVKAA